MDDALNADLHCHSVHSDGTLTPRALVERARDRGVGLWALTDHDEVGGLDEALAAARAIGLACVPGVEVSVSHGEVTLHVVGLGIDHRHPVLVEGLARTRGGREQRARDMAAALERVGVRGAFEGAMRYAGNPRLVSRTHFARYLVEAGYCRDTREVFRRYLVEGKPGYVPHRWASLAEAVHWIRAAGGVAVLAHPGRYPLGGQAQRALLAEFKALGGTAVEVVTSAHDDAETRRYAGLCRQFGLLASRGSDFHGPHESACDLGALPPLPTGITPVWTALAGWRP
jgi:predicted metal-dependent phosphoesterase TrpH